MLYVDADNNLEYALLEDISEIKQGIQDNHGINCIVLIDRIAGYSTDKSILGDNFTDTRLYRITNGRALRLGGEEYFPEIGSGKDIRGKHG